MNKKETPAIIKGLTKSAAYKDAIASIAMDKTGDLQTYEFEDLHKKCIDKAKVKEVLDEWEETHNINLGPEINKIYKVVQSAIQRIRKDLNLE